MISAQVTCRGPMLDKQTHLVAAGCSPIPGAGTPLALLHGICVITARISYLRKLRTLVGEVAGEQEQVAWLHHPREPHEHGAVARQR